MGFKISNGVEVEKMSEEIYENEDDLEDDDFIDLKNLELSEIYKVLDDDKFFKSNKKFFKRNDVEEILGEPFCNYLLDVNKMFNKEKFKNKAALHNVCKMLKLYPGFLPSLDHVDIENPIPPTKEDELILEIYSIVDFFQRFAERLLEGMEQLDEDQEND
jgi:hypothetical protein